MKTARNTAAAPRLADWSFGILVLAIGFANLMLVHPVPAAAYVLVALVYLPPARDLLKKRVRDRRSIRW